MSRASPPLLHRPAAMLGAGALVLALSLGLRHTFGLFLAPMSRDNGWTREVFGFAIALQNLVWGFAQPFAGRLADRIGAGKAVLGGSVLYVAGLALMAGAHTGSALALSAGLLIGIGLSGTTMSVVFGAVARAMPPEKRSLAFGIAMSVGSIGQSFEGRDIWLVTLTDAATGRSVTVVIDDRGPFGEGRVIDLSPEAFAALAPLGRGILHVELSW